MHCPYDANRLSNSPGRQRMPRCWSAASNCWAVQYIGFMRGVLCAGMTNMDMKFIRVIGEGDLVAVDYTNAMTHSDTFRPVR